MREGRRRHDPHRRCDDRCEAAGRRRSPKKSIAIWLNEASRSPYHSVQSPGGFVQIEMSGAPASARVGRVSTRILRSVQTGHPKGPPRVRLLCLADGQKGLYEAGNGLVERIGILTGTGEHHAAFERCNDLKGPRFCIGSADPLGYVLNASAEEGQYFVGDFG
jgi:hypothetical protein